MDLGERIRAAMLVLALGISTPACTTEGQAADPSLGRRGPSPSSEILPVEIYDNLVFLKVQVNGSTPHSFLLDTGANSSFINESLARSLGLKPKRSFEAEVGTGETSTSLGIARHVTLKFGNVDLPATKILVTELAPLEARIGHEIAGIVGADVFTRYVVTIDYAAQTIAISSPKRFSYQGPAEVLAYPYKRRSSVP